MRNRELIAFLAAADGLKHSQDRHPVSQSHTIRRRCTREDDVEKAAKQALLQKVADLVGQDMVAARLRVPMTLLDVWMRGLASIPDRKVIPLADLLDEFDESNKR